MTKVIKKIEANGNQILNEKNKRIKKVSKHLYKCLLEMGFDPEDQNLKETPNRVAKMWINELFSGCSEEEPKVTIFENVKDYDQIIVLDSIDLISTCSHHFMPFHGKAYIAYIPDKKIVGVSKLARVVQWYMKRPQIQEELTCQIANYINEVLQPLGVGVIIKAKHYCMIARGVKQNNSEMITSKLIGNFKENQVKNEFLKLIEIKE